MKKILNLELTETERTKQNYSYLYIQPRFIMDPTIPICDCILAILVTLMRSPKLSVQLCLHIRIAC